MGLDSVELVMRIEEEFSIDLPDAELESTRTVGDLYELVLSKLKMTLAADCLSSKAFYRTRRAIVDSLRLPRRSIRPSTPLDQLVPKQVRRAQWGKITKKIELNFPRLVHPKRWKPIFLSSSMIWATIVILLFIGIVLKVAAHSIFVFLFGSTIVFCVGFVFWILIFVITDVLLRRYTPFLCTEFPVSTVGDLASMVLTMNYLHFSPATDGKQIFSKEYVWERLVFIFCDQLQIDPEAVVPDATIVDDLGVS
jgi:hypothetical protein